MVSERAAAFGAAEAQVLYRPVAATGIDDRLQVCGRLMVAGFAPDHDDQPAMLGYKEAVRPGGLFVTLCKASTAPLPEGEPHDRAHSCQRSSRLTPNMAFCHICKLRSGKANSN